MTKYLLYIIMILPITIYGQNSTQLKTSDIEELISYNWVFEKALDENGIEVNEFIRNKKNHDGSDFTYNASHPPMSINKDFSYAWHKGGKYESSGTWRITSQFEIEFTLITKKGSRGYPMMKMAEKMFGKKTKKNKDGSYIDISKNKVIDINEKGLVLLLEDRYQVIFTKY